MAKSVNNFNFDWFCLGGGVGCTVRCGSQGQAKGKGSLEQRIAVTGQVQTGVVQRDLFCRLLLSSVSLLEQGVG